MGKRNDEAAAAEGNTSTEIDTLKSKIAQMEEIVKGQALEFKSELAHSQARMQTEFKEQLNDFLATFMKLQTSTPPPTGQPPESAASNMGQATDFQTLLGEKTPPSHPFMSSASPHPTMQFPKPPHTKPPLTTLPPITQTPLYGMPTTSWIPTSSYNPTLNTSLSFQPQTPQLITQSPWPTTVNPSYYYQTQPHNPPNPHPYQAYTIFTQPSTHIPTSYPYHTQPPHTNQLQWPRPQVAWPEFSNPQPQLAHQTLHPSQHENQFAQAFSKGIKLDFPKFDGENPMGWLQQAEKCFALAETPIHKRVKFAEVFLVGKADHCLRSTEINTSNLTWSEFATLISTRFAAETSFELIDSFRHVAHTSSLNNYIDAF
jgi:hypothetical protein